MLVLVFDTETNGLPPKIPRGENQPTIDEMASTWPYIVQLSGILFDTTTRQVLDLFDMIIQIPPTVQLPDECVAIHGISRDMCDEKGINIKEALCKFVTCLDKAHIIVAHNLQFDRTLIEVELHRNGYHNAFRKSHKIEYCTMNYGDKITKLTMTSKITGKLIRKSPKLIELYEHLFGKVEDGKKLNLHNSLIDVLICARCYTKMSLNDDIFVWKDKSIELMKTILYDE